MLADMTGHLGWRASPVDPARRDAYLRRLGFLAPPPVTIDALRELHRAHVERVPYETLWMTLGEARTVDPDEALAAIAGPGGRGGYCYHVQGAFATLLAWLGFEVRWHLTGIQNRSVPAPHLERNHLGLTVAGVPAPESPDGAWLVDVGLGDGIYEPIPLRFGSYRQGPFEYRLRPSDVAPGGWRLDHDPLGSFEGMDLAPVPVVAADLAEKHRWLSTSPESGFAGAPVVERRDKAGVDAMRGCVFKRLDATGKSATDLTSERDWFAALADVFGMTLSDVDPAARAALWQRVYADHLAWVERASVP